MTYLSIAGLLVWFSRMESVDRMVALKLGGGGW